MSWKKAYFNILYGQAYKYEITKEHKFLGICHADKAKKKKKGIFW